LTYSPRPCAGRGDGGDVVLPALQIGASRSLAPLPRVARFPATWHRRAQLPDAASLATNRCLLVGQGLITFANPRHWHGCFVLYRAHGPFIVGVCICSLPSGVRGWASMSEIQ